MVSWGFRVSGVRSTPLPTSRLVGLASGSAPPGVAEQALHYGGARRSGINRREEIRVESGISDLPPPYATEDGGCAMGFRPMQVQNMVKSCKK